MGNPIIETGIVKYAIGTDFGDAKAVVCRGEDGRFEISFQCPDGEVFVHFSIGTLDDLREAKDEKNAQSNLSRKGKTLPLPF